MTLWERKISMATRFVRLFLIVIVVAKLAACTTTPSAVSQGETKEDVKTTSEQVLAESESEAIDTVGQSIRQFNRDQNKQSLIEGLLNTADSLVLNFSDKQDCYQAEIILKHLLEIGLEPYEKAKSNILRSECAFLTHSDLDSQTQTLANVANNPLANKVHTGILRVDTWLKQIPDTIVLEQPWLNRKHILDAYLEAYKSNYELALTRLFEATENRFSGEDGKLIYSPLVNKSQNAAFKWYSRLDPVSRVAMVQSYPSLFVAQQWLSVIEDSSLNDKQRQAQLLALIRQQQNNNPGLLIPNAITQYLSVDVPEQQKIAVLLPLSGRLASQGDAIKQGIIAGYMQNLVSSNSAAFDEISVVPSPLVEFIDTGSENTLNDSINAERLSAYTSVVGPLLKPHIDAVKNMVDKNTLLIALNTIEADTEDKNEPGLLVNYSEPLQAEHALNQSQAITPNAEEAHQTLSAFFALSPEQEAVNLARLIQTEGIKHPIIIHDNASITHRMLDAFLDEWTSTQKSMLKNEDKLYKPSIVSYADNQSMRVGITSALDVLQSEKRISQLSNLANERVYSVTRNRRDVDAFVVFARPNEVELINPIIESSMSLFSDEQIPVYASSMSYNHKQNRNSLRDLRNLVFLDMPFLMPEMRETSLAKQVDEVFNSPSSTFLRLFAFGFDAAKLTQQILRMQIFDHVEDTGISGRLSVDQDGIIQRELDTLIIQGS
uniref:penicillin-binding protein activator n=1 Tax=Ningiella ruwaisensis TaxID=2364274 RepID=UPI0010A03AA4|nr:penicillin-binding protein activator [Ningiella ruwaisensis]